MSHQERTTETRRARNECTGLWLRVLWLSVVGFLAWTGEARADEPVVLKAALAEGRVLRYDVNAQLELKSSENGEPVRVNQKLRLRFTVAHADKEGALVRAKLEAAHVRATSPGKDAQEFDWKEGDDAPAEDGPPVAKLYRQLCGTVFELKLDPEWMIESISGLDRVAAAAKGERDVVRTMGVLAPESAPRTLQWVFTLDPLGRAHSPGESWSFTQDVPAGVWQTSAKTDYTIKGLVGGVAAIAGLTTITPRPLTESESGLKPRMEIASQAITIDAAWDTRESHLAGRTIDSKVSFRAVVPVKQPIEATSTTTARIVVTWVADPKDPAK